MAEEDYQRGLRGGPARVTTEYDRWSDWKAGYSEYERQLDQEIDALLPPEEAAARSEARYQEEMRKLEAREELYREGLRQQEKSDRQSNNILSFVIPFVFWSSGPSSAQSLVLCFRGCFTYRVPRPSAWQ
jgi:hypothetical protein